VTLHVELVSPERILYSGDAQMVVCRTVRGGEIAFMPGHVPFIGALDVYPVRIKHETGGEDVFAVFGGFVEVSADNVTILSDAAEMPGDIDAEAARRARDEADAAVRAATSDEAAEAARHALAVAEVRLDVAQAAPARTS
jgi:F-type H+-transporting ATPase subunit epsilon